MAGGLLALLDDVAALVKITAASLDDIPAHVAKTSGKVSGVVIDDAAVTPKYVTGLSPKRELAIIWRIARASYVNKLLFIAPGVLGLGYFAPWAMTPILMLGGTYLCVEGYEKVHDWIAHPATDEGPTINITSPEKLENTRVKGAVRTDMILSAEIITIAYSTVADQGLATQAAVLFFVAIAITTGIYGFVGFIVKIDDIGLYLAKNSNIAALRAAGRWLVKAMPAFLKLLGIVGTVAMLWVGGEILAHGIGPLNHALHQLHESAGGSGLLPWLAKAFASALGGLVWGGIVAVLVHTGSKWLPPKKEKAS